MEDGLQGSHRDLSVEQWCLAILTAAEGSVGTRRQDDENAARAASHYFAGVLAFALMVCHSPARRSQLINPTAELVKEEQLLNEAKRICRCMQHLPDQKACTLEQPRGQDRRYFYQVPSCGWPWLAILGMARSGSLHSFGSADLAAYWSMGGLGCVMKRFSGF